MNATLKEVFRCKVVKKAHTINSVAPSRQDDEPSCSRSTFPSSAHGVTRSLARGVQSVFLIEERHGPLVDGFESHHNGPKTK